MSNSKFLLSFVNTFRFYRETFHSVPNIVLTIVNNVKDIWYVVYLILCGHCNNITI